MSAPATVQYNSSGLIPIRMEQDSSDGSYAQIIELCGPGPQFYRVNVDAAGYAAVADPETKILLSQILDVARALYVAFCGATEQPIDESVLPSFTT